MRQHGADNPNAGGVSARPGQAVHEAAAAILIELGDGGAARVAGAAREDKVDSAVVVVVAPGQRSMVDAG